MATRHQQAKAPILSIPAFREDSTDAKKDVQEWMRRFDIYMACVQETTGDQSDEYKKGTLQLLLGQEGLKDFARSPDYERRGEMDFDEFRDSVVNHFRKRTSKTKARVDFARRVQEPGETVHDFIQALRRIAEDCRFADLDDALQTQLMAGTSDQRAQTELMARVDTPALEDIIKILQASESAVDDLKKLRGTPPQVAAIRGRGRGFRADRGSFRGCGGNPRGRGGQRWGGERSTGSSNNCTGCGAIQHKTRDPQCPALGKKCLNCSRLNHVARMCRQQQQQRGQGTGKAATSRDAASNAVMEWDSSDEDQANVCKVNNMGPQLQTTLIRETFHIKCKPKTFVPVEMLVDTGANTSILSEETWRKRLSDIVLKKTRTPPTGANGRKLEGCLGTMTTKIAYGGRCQQGKLYVFAGRGIDTIGTNFLKALRTVVDLDNMKIHAAAALTKMDINRDFPKLCGDDMGTYKGRAHQIQLQPGTMPEAVKLFGDKRLIFDVPASAKTKTGRIRCSSKTTTVKDGKKIKESITYNRNWSSKKEKGKGKAERQRKKEKRKKDSNGKRSRKQKGEWSHGKKQIDEKPPEKADNIMNEAEKMAGAVNVNGEAAAAEESRNVAVSTQSGLSPPSCRTFISDTSEPSSAKAERQKRKNVSSEKRKEKKKREGKKNEKKREKKEKEKTKKGKKKERCNGYLKAGIQTFGSGNWKQQVEQLITTYRQMIVDGQRTAMDIFYGRKTRTAAEPNRVKPSRRTSEQQSEAINPENPLGPRTSTTPRRKLKEYSGWSTFRMGQQVMTKKPQVAKGISPWHGPKTVEKVLGAYTYLLSDNKVWNLRKMKCWTKAPPGDGADDKKGGDDV